MITLTEIWKRYESDGVGFFALKDISLKVEKGDFVSILGPSGSGKSTLMHLMGGLDRPTEGKVVIDSTDLGKLTDRELARFRNRKIGFVFQQFNLLPHLSALENVVLPLMYSGIVTERKHYAAQMLEYFGLGGKLYNRPTQLSGGEQQRVAIARALICDPEIIFADEPTGNLDSVNGAGVFDALVQLNHLGKTLVIVTHDHALAERAGGIVRLQDGQVV